MKKRLLLLGLAAVLVVTALAVVGCNQAEEAIDDAGEAAEAWLHPALADVVAGDGRTLTVATDPTYPPFESMEGDTPVGFDIDLAKALAEELGAEIRFTFLEWDALLTALSADSRDFDFAASAMTIRPDRAETILFSNPYFVSFQALAVPADSDIKSFDDVTSGVRIGVQSGTTGNIFADEHLSDLGVVIRPYPGGVDCFMAMQSGEVDGVIIDVGVAALYAADDAFDIKNLGPIPAAEQENFGLAFGKSRTTLADAINEALAAVIASGKYAEIYAKWIDADNPPVMP